MSSINLKLRCISPEVMTALKQEAERLHTSVNLLALELVEHGIGFSQKINRPVFHDLDKLAGTWTDKDAKEFDTNIKDLEC
jgi:hypothetical protein